MSDRLRALLDQMVNDLPVGAHAARLEAIRDMTPHAISILPAPEDEPLEEFNCIMHALGIVARLEHACGPLGRWYADTGFVRYLVAQAVLTPCGARCGAIITWSSAEGLKHAGRIVSPGRVLSKWGVGHVYEHGFDEVPASYGNRMDFYGGVESGTVLAYLAGYVRHHGCGSTVITPVGT